MIYPENIESKIGFDQIRELIRKNCMSELGRSYVDKIQFLTNSSVIEKLLLQTEDFRKILVSGDEFPSSHYLNIAANLNSIQVERSYLSEEETYEVGLALGTIISCIEFLTTNKEVYPSLYELSAPIEFDASLHQVITNKFEPTATLKDNASDELLKIRSEIHRQDQRLRKTIEGILKKARDNGYSPGDGQVSIREGRLVIPVLAENKKRIKGVVQDESATGQTVFIEPTEVIEVNNEIRELHYQERRAVINILIGLSDLIRPSIQVLLKANQFLGTIDFIRAKAKLASELNAVLPEISSGDTHKLESARHPLLFIYHKKIGRQVVPLNFILNTKQRILVISGPNAGGKSVSLKTVGLLQYMFQSGLLIPVGESSKVKVFQKLFIDIGDEQSIENDLSTYSSHLRNLKHFLDHADGKTLFLIDEFGTGTEPQFGGSIAEVILSQLNDQGSYGVVTTHYSNLKKMAEKSPGIINGAMRFDSSKLAPLYQLDIGKPGSSFALEIAGNIGLGKSLIEKAKKLVGYSHVKFDKLVNQLEFEKTQYQEKIATLKEKQEWLETEHRDYQDLKEHLENERREILNAAKREAEMLLNSANKKIEKTIKDIREAKADKEKTQKARLELTQHKDKVSLPIRKKKSVVTTSVSKPPIVGDQVRIIGQESIGELIRIKGKKAEVMMGSIKSLVNFEKIEKVVKTEEKSYDRNTRVKSLNYNRRAADFTSNLDLRGNRASEAVSKLDAFLDEALLLGITELRIIHGKGDGVLREAIRNYLRDYDYIKSVKDEHVDHGGAGVSLITLD